MTKYPELMYKTLQLKKKIPIQAEYYMARNIDTIDLSVYDIGDYIKIGKKYYQVIKAKI